MSFVEEHPDAVRSLVTGRYAPEEHGPLLSGDKKSIKNVVTFDE